jgi:hypothetical protein
MASSSGDVGIGLNTTCHGLSFFAELFAHYLDGLNVLYFNDLALPHQRHDLDRTPLFQSKKAYITKTSKTNI